ncbi:plasmid mobilization protein, partial [Bacillus cereus]
MTFIHKTYLQITLDEQDKEMIKNKAEELGYKTVSAFLIDSAKTHFRLEIDMKVYRDLTKEINYIGKNINSLIRRIHTDGIYTDQDMDFLKVNQKKIIKIIQKEY